MTRTIQGAEPKRVTGPAEPEVRRRRGDRPVEPTIFEKHTAGMRAMDLPALDVPETAIPAELVGAGPAWPALGQLQVIRHYTHLSQRNFSVDGEFYPLGSCTMKYNPRVNEWAAAQAGLRELHPNADSELMQGMLELLARLERMLAEIAGLPVVSLQPAAGAHGEFTALKIIRAYFRDQGQPQRRVVLTPSTAHGTNPASCAMCGAAVRVVATDGGYTDIDDLRRAIDEVGADRVAALMITNPNTAGLFDAHIGRIAELMHEAGALLYLDGANMNAILGVARPGEFGTDIMHFNTHKTFSTPHGCGGPGAGPLAMREFLEPYRPVPRIVRTAGGRWAFDYDAPKSIGRVRSFIGQIGVLVRCYTYLRALGPAGLRAVAEQAVVNANYVAARLRDVFDMPYFDPATGRFCAHEFVTVPRRLLNRGVRVVDMAKRLIDYGFHPPTMHWPVIDCLMIEPTETESKAMLDAFVDAMRAIAAEVDADPASLADAPHDAVVERVDEVSAARRPVLVWPELPATSP